MVSASSDFNFEGLILDEVQNINKNSSDLSLDKFDIDIYESSDQEGFDDKSDKNEGEEREY